MEGVSSVYRESALIDCLDDLRSDCVTSDGGYVWDSLERSEVGGIEWFRKLFAHGGDACFWVWRHGVRIVRN